MDQCPLKGRNHDHHQMSSPNVLFDLLFGDDMLILTDTAEGVPPVLNALIASLDSTGLKLNTSRSKAVILTTGATIFTTQAIHKLP